MDDSEGKLRAKILAAARSKIGISYDKLDCSHMVNAAYSEAGLDFPYTETRNFKAKLIGTYFFVTETPNPGDLILYTGHVGIYDPDGCSIINSTACKSMGKQAGSMRILSARSRKNLGVEYGQSGWFGSGQYLAWKDFVSSPQTTLTP